MVTEVIKENKHRSGMSTNRAALILAVSMLLSKITGFVREIIIVPTLGYGINTDAYFIGFQLPDLVYQLMIGGAIGAALIPTVSYELTANREKRLWKSLSVFINVFGLGTLLFVLVGEIFAPAFINFYNGDKDPQVIARALSVTRNLFPQVFFMMVAALFGGVLEGYRLFGRAGFSAVIYNVCCIVFIIKLGSEAPEGPSKAALGVVIASLINLAYILLMTSGKLKHFRFTLDIKDTGYRRLLSLAVPTIISGAVIQINSIVQTAFANQFQGAVTALQHGVTLWQTPYGIIAVSFGSVLIPELSMHFANRNYKMMRQAFTSSMRKVLYLMTPFFVLFLVLAEETVEVVYQWHNSIPVARILIEGNLLRIYAVTMMIHSMIYLYNNAFYARKITRISLVTSLLSLILIVTFSFIFTKVLHFGIYGLPVAYTVNALVILLLLKFFYRNSMPEARPYKIRLYAFKVFICALVMTIFMLALNTLPLDSDHKIWQIVIYVAKFFSGFWIYYLAGTVLNINEAHEFRHLLGKLLPFLR